jgi:lipopolysaccharide export system protein LptA
MRGTRWLLLVAIVAILGGIGFTYRAQKKALEAAAPPKPAPLPPGLNSSSQGYEWVQTDTKTGRRIFELRADQFQEVRDSSRADLTGIVLKLPNKTGDAYDLVKSSAASIFSADHHVYSDGAVAITLGLPLVGEPEHTPVSIQTSGVTCDSDTGHVWTDRATSFTFERGEGTANGASYDPATLALILQHDVVVNWKTAGPNPKPMKIEAGRLEYREKDALILLTPWGRLTRENMVVEGEGITVRLQEDSESRKSISKVDGTKAHGTGSYPNRKLQYSADELWIDFDESGVIRKITAQTNAQLLATSATAETNVTAYHVEMEFDTSSGDSVLTAVETSGNSVMTSRPLPVAGRQMPETHVLRSDRIGMKMKDGGQEIDTVVAHTPGTLEFLPNLPAHRHRRLDGNNMVISYGPQNRLQTFRATDVRTQTEPTAEEVKRKIPQSVTASRTILATFEPNSSRLATMEQSGDFTYEQGDRKARAAKATLDSTQNIILLETAARMSDASGSTAADHIRMDQRTGDYTATGNVISSRLPDRDQKKNSELLSGDQPIQAQAAKMESYNRNRRVHYEGGAVLWQGANRVQANVIDIDRQKRSLVADGNVVTNLWEEPQADPKDPRKKKGGSPVLTVVRAPHLVYTEENRLAVYTGGVRLERPGLQVNGKELQAYLADSGSDSRLEKAFADGAVHIVQTSRDGTRTGTGEHGEYYTADQRVFLSGGTPRLVEKKPDNKVETTEGSDLTYFANDDRLLVNGSPARPGQSRIQRK